MARINRSARLVLIALALTAFCTVLTGYLPGHGPQPDEGAAAHIFQLSIVLWLVTAVTFITTADWTDPLRQLRRLAFPATIVALAFVALYYLEHAWYVHPI